MKRVNFAVAFLPLALTGCMTLKPKFIPVGDYGSEETKVTPSVSSPAQIRIIEGLPAGFSWEDKEGYAEYNEELVVEKGFGHTILGYIKVDYPDVGICDTAVSKETVMRELRQGAFSHGANAVVDAHSNVGDHAGWSMFWNPCKYMGERGGYGHGWAVLLEEPKHSSARMEP